MGIKLKGRGISLIFAVLIITQIADMSCVSSLSLEKNTELPCNGTVGSCLHEDDEGSELLLDSEVSRRSLQYTGSKICYKGLERPPVCNADIYGNCIKPINKYQRACSLYNRCKRAGR
ncbi:hypothetical protein L1049_002738 [Liquidambar formosana]|uniref:Uncharacterized protein n=1 Tax=Liquidambar formosana TaxID=63359 RepID=A0AAP0R6Y6_LIQFO